jgi:hypothetical protein
MILFGNGHGMGQPIVDGVFYWINDTGSKGSRARFYRFSHGLGAQLHSWELKAPIAGTRRVLDGREYVVFSTRRSRFWIMHEVAWASISLPHTGDLDALNDEIRDIKRSLQSL